MAIILIYPVACTWHCTWMCWHCMRMLQSFEISHEHGVPTLCVLWNHEPCFLQSTENANTDLWIDVSIAPEWGDLSEITVSPVCEVRSYSSHDVYTVLLLQDLCELPQHLRLGCGHEVLVQWGVIGWKWVLISHIVPWGNTALNYQVSVASNAPSYSHDLPFPQLYWEIMVLGWGKILATTLYWLMKIMNLAALYGHTAYYMLALLCMFSVLTVFALCSTCCLALSTSIISRSWRGVMDPL